MKFNLNSLVVCLFILVITTNFIRSDLPVHCLKHDIIGNWMIKASTLLKVESGHDMKCGHQEPSNEETSHLAKSPYEFNKTYTLHLKNPNVATIEIDGKVHKGTWTMVYDEGFSVNFTEFTFFAFSKYLIELENGTKSYKSQCNSTCVGWYNNKDKSKWGCYQAFKIGEDSKKITYLNSKNNLNIVEPTQNVDENTILSSMLNMQFKSVGNEIIFQNEKSQLRKRSSFLEEQGMTMLKLDSSFKMHSMYISKINSLKKSWNAGLHSNFSNLTIRELNKIAGRPKINTMMSKFRFKSKEIRNFEEDVSMYPKNFDWKKILKPSGSQGNCGSCYVYSTMRMLEARLKIKYNHDIDLSVQQALDCSIYNQGCNGGYPYLVMKFANEFNLVPESCKPYKESVGLCKENYCDLKTIPYIYKVEDYKYVGGSYGQCSQKLMMDELQKNGPIVISFEPDYNFMMYSDGIYHSFDNDSSWITKNLPKPEWQKVDHSVLLVGWGEEKNGEKFWIIQNTWGPKWGEEGFFRMKRGTDEFGVESICEVASPIIIDNKTGNPLYDNNHKVTTYTNGNLTSNSKIEKHEVVDSLENASIFDVFK